MKKKLLAMLVVVVLTASMFVGCDTDAQDDANTVVIRILGDPVGFIPNHRADDNGYGIHQNMYHRLLKLDAEHTPIPDLAHSFSVSDDGHVITFYLRDDIFWHDGVQVTSADVKYTFDTIAASEGYFFNPAMRIVDSIDTPDDFTVVFNKNTANVGFVTQLSWYGIFILPKHVLDIGVPWADHPTMSSGAIGSGPFMYESYTMGVAATLVANPNFHTVPQIERLIYQIIPDDATAVQALLTGEIDFMTGVPIPMLPDVQGNANIRLDRNVFPSPTRILFRVDRYPLDNPVVRRAISMAIPRQYVSERLFNGIQAPEYNMYPSLVSWVSNYVDVAPSHDPAAARALLEENGFVADSDGYFIRGITKHLFSSGVNPDIGLLFQASAREAGIEIILEPLDTAAWTSRVSVERDFMLAMQGGNMGPDPAEMVSLVGTGGARNHMGFSNEEVDALLVRGGTTGDRELRRHYYWEVQRILAEELVLVPIVSFAHYEAANARLRNIPIEGTGRWGWAEWTYAYFAD